MRMRVFRSVGARLRRPRQVSNRSRRAGLSFVSLGIGLVALCPVSAQENIAYSYDALGRLVKVAHSGTVNSSTTACYTYDHADNRTNVTVSTTSDCAAAPPSFSIGDSSATEGGTVTFTVTRMGSLAATDTVQYATATGGTATAGSDYTAKAATTLTFGPGVATLTASVVTLQDALVEGNETFIVNLSSPSAGTSIADGQAIGTIIDDDSNPVCSGVSFTVASSGAVTEGATSNFTITKTGTATGSCTVNYATSNGTAVSGSDYTAKSGTLTFTSAQTSQVVSVATIDDTAVESAETFALALSAPTSGAVLGTPSSATATINDNDTAAAPSFAIQDASATEGQTLDFVVTKTGTTTGSFSVNYATADGTATAPLKYTAASGTLTFGPTDTTKDILIQTVATSAIETTPKQMYVNLSSATAGSTISTSKGTGTINDQCSTASTAAAPASSTGTASTSSTDTTDTMASPAALPGCP